MDEVKLVKKAKKGDAIAFEELLSLHSDQLYRTAYLYVGHKEDGGKKSCYKSESKSYKQRDRYDRSKCLF